MDVENSVKAIQQFLRRSNTEHSLTPYDVLNLIKAIKREDKTDTGKDPQKITTTLVVIIPSVPLASVCIFAMNRNPNFIVEISQASTIHPDFQDS